MKKLSTNQQRLEDKKKRFADKKKGDKENKPINKKTIFLLFIITGPLLAAYLLSVYSSILGKGNIYLVPKNYSGWICVYYNSTGDELLKDNDGYSIIKVPTKGVFRTSSRKPAQDTKDQFVYLHDKQLYSADKLYISEHHNQKNALLKKETLDMFWVSSGDPVKDYEKYIKDGTNKVKEACIGSWY